MTKTEKLFRMYSLVALSNGMKADNLQRELNRESLSYTGNDFFRISDELSKLALVEEVN